MAQTMMLRCCEAPQSFKPWEPTAWQLHWLPMRQRVELKIATLVHQPLSGRAPSYLA